MHRPFSFSSGSPGTVVLHVGPGLHPAPGSSGLRARRQRHMSRVAAKRASCCSRRGGAGGAAQWHARRIAKQERKTCVQVARTGFQASSVYRFGPRETQAAEQRHRRRGMSTTDFQSLCQQVCRAVKAGSLFSHMLGRSAHRNARTVCRQCASAAVVADVGENVGDEFPRGSSRHVRGDALRIK